LDKAKVRAIVVVGALDLVVFVSGIALSAPFDGKVHAARIYLGTVMALLIITFWGFYCLTGNMRETIAAAFVMAYFSIASMLLLMPDIRHTLNAEQSQTLEKLNTFFGFVLGFYFAGSIAEKAVEAYGRHRVDESPKDKVSPYDAVPEVPEGKSDPAATGTGKI
jgi:hypothetical protein